MKLNIFFVLIQTNICQKEKEKFMFLNIKLSRMYSKSIFVVNIGVN
jgi:hypothetical protein